MPEYPRVRILSILPALTKLYEQVLLTKLRAETSVKMQTSER